MKGGFMQPVNTMYIATLENTSSTALIEAYLATSNMELKWLIYRLLRIIRAK